LDSWEIPFLENWSAHALETKRGHCNADSFLKVEYSIV